MAPPTAAILHRALARGRDFDETPEAWEARKGRLEEAIASLPADDNEHDVCPVAVSP